METWFSAAVKYGFFVEGRGLVQMERDILVFRSQDYDEAKGRALALGLSREHSFVNQDGQNTRKRLIETLTLDWVGNGDIDGLEVHSQSDDPSTEERMLSDQDLHPESSTPTNTGVGELREGETNALAPETRPNF